jgi:hypothetical protein
LAKELNANSLNIYNGDDFIIPYLFFVFDKINNKVLFQLDAYNSYRVLGQNNIQNIINEIKVIDGDRSRIVFDLIGQSEYFLENGLLIWRLFPFTRL